jgi:hypothetical protein
MFTNVWKRTKATFTQLNATTRVLAPLFLALAVPLQLSAAGPEPVNLLSTANFVILSGAAITTTGGGIINGNVGASPIAGSAIGVTCAQVNGTIYAVDASGPACAVINPTLLTQAKSDLTTAYNDAAGRTPVPSGPFLNPNGGNIGGLNLGPGLYKFTTTAYITGSDVTLTGGPSDVWIFQCAQDLQLGSGIKVILAGGAQAANIFWQVGTSAVLGTFSKFSGTILASQSITMNTSSTLEGRALAFTAAVTFNGNGAAVPAATAPGIAVQQPPGTNLVNGVGTNNFGSVALGASTSLTFTITNIGTANLTDLAVTIDGPDSTMFSVTTNPMSPVSPGGSTTFTVRFAPVVPGVRTAALHIANNDINNNPFNIAITGTGTGMNSQIAGIVVQMPPGTTLVNGVGANNFGSVALGANTSLTFTISNIGSTNLTGLGITLDGPDSTMFSVTTHPVAPVSPGGSTTFTVRFAPVGLGVRTAALHIANNDIFDEPFNIAISGTGTDPGISVSTNVFVNVRTAGISPILLDAQTGLFKNSVLLTNSGINTVAAVRLYILNLPGDVQVFDQSGSTTNGTPYVQYNFPLAPGATADFWIEYYRASGLVFPTPTYVPEDTTAVTVTVTGGASLMINENILLSSGGFLIGFDTAAGRSYAVQYSTDLTTWQTVAPILIAPANYLRWIDQGPPQTQGMPSTRFYRAFQLP